MIINIGEEPNIMEIHAYSSYVLDSIISG